MTIATCIYCGATKFGALTECGKCQRRPENGDDILASLERIDPRDLAIREKIMQGLMEASVRKTARQRAIAIYAAVAVGLSLAAILAWYWN